MWLKSLLGICIKADVAGIQHLSPIPEHPSSGLGQKIVDLGKLKFILFSNPSFNHGLSCSDQEPLCGQRDGEEYGGGGTGLQAGHHVILLSHWEFFFMTFPTGN
jgi:hypothetical protein